MYQRSRRPFLLVTAMAVTGAVSLSGCAHGGAERTAAAVGSGGRETVGLPGTATRAAAGAAVNSGSAASGPSATSPISPDAKITPGDVLPVTAKDICVSGYSKLVRNVPQSVKEQAYKNYGITHRAKGEYEVDHLISLELGGSNSIKNLWPESFVTQPWNAHVKDQLENELHKEICSGTIDIATAQKEIAQDWIASYKKHFHTNVPLSDKEASKSYGGGAARHESKSRNGNAPDDAPPLAAANAPVSGSSDKVWVNTRSGVYWRSGTEFYGKTKEGAYMTEQAAIQAGYHAAKSQ